MNFFKRIHKKNWYDINLDQFNRLTALGQNPSLRDVVDIVYDVDINTIKISDISKYSVDFISKPVPRSTIKKAYKLNGTEYTPTFDITKLTTAQFFDFRNYAQKDDFVGILTVCLVPKGKEYNEGYNIEDVRKDVLSFPITDAQTVGFFFKNQLVVLLRAILSSSTHQLKELKNPKIDQLVEQIEKLDWNSLTSSL